MTTFLNKLKNLNFGPVYPFWGQKIFFRENPALSCVTACGFLTPLRYLEKTNHPVLRKRTAMWIEGRTDEETIFYRTFTTIAGCPIKLKCSNIEDLLDISPLQDI